MGSPTRKLENIRAFGEKCYVNDSPTFADKTLINSLYGVK